MIAHQSKSTTCVRRFSVGAIVLALGAQMQNVSAQCFSFPLPATLAPGANFGQSIAWDGNLAIVGAPQDRNSADAVVGAVYIYRRAGLVWTQEARFVGDGQNGVLGAHVTISASGFAAASRPSANPFANLGLVQTYVRNNATGTWSASTGILGVGYFDDFPSALCMDGAEMIVGMGTFPFSGDADYGHYAYNGAGFVAIDDATNMGTGDLVSIDFQGLTMVVGNPNPQGGNPVRAYLLRRSSIGSSDWGALPGHNFVSADPASVDFGRAVAYSAAGPERVVIGDPLASSAGAGAGAAYVFVNNAGTWSLEQTLHSPLPEAGSNFGHSVAISGATILIGQPGVAGGAGRVFVFDASASAPIWRYTSALIGDGLTSSTARVGAALALQGVGALLGATGEANAAGAAMYTPNVHCTMTGFCAGDGSASACPCGNSSPAGSGRGCLNSFGTGALLTGSGTAQVANDMVQLQLSATPPTGHAPTFFQGTLAADAGSTFGDGLRCASGSVVRLGTRTSVNGAVSFGFGIAGDPLISAQGAIPLAGATRYYQANYRNGVAFCTPAPVNTSNGLKVVWSP
jgi:hypothetical protein